VLYYFPREREVFDVCPFLRLHYEGKGYLIYAAIEPATKQERSDEAHTSPKHEQQAPPARDALACASG
jgi:hypothetical protein